MDIKTSSRTVRYPTFPHGYPQFCQKMSIFQYLYPIFLYKCLTDGSSDREIWTKQKDSTMESFCFYTSGAVMENRTPAQSLATTRSTTKL